MRSVTERKRILDQSDDNLRQLINVLGEEITMMSSADVRALPGLVELGNHSYSHESMALQPDKYFKEDYFRACRVFKAINVSPRIYAFPNGNYQQWMVDFLFEQNVKNILLVNDSYSSINSRVHDRITFYAETISEAKVRASGILLRR
jgi:peptidoglycan/xylan/chitin deacetylase (PgdA/CDA1 family)